MLTVTAQPAAAAARAFLTVEVTEEKKELSCNYCCTRVLISTSGVQQLIVIESQMNSSRKSKRDPKYNRVYQQKNFLFKHNKKMPHTQHTRSSSARKEKLNQP